MRNIGQHRRVLLLALMVAVLILPGTAVAQNPEPSDTSGGEEPTPEGETSVVELESGEKVVPDQVIVKFKKEASGTAKEDTRSDEGLEKTEDLDLIDAEVDKLEGQSVEEAISDLEARPEVEYAEPDHIVKLEGYSDERRFGELWGLHNTGQLINGSTGTDDVDINAPEASAITQGDKNLVVAVIDDGVDFTHPDLTGRQWTNPGESGGGKETNGVDDDKNGFVDDVNGWDFHNGDKSVHDANDYHGTHVSGTIAASANGEGVVGVASNVKIMALKFIGPRGGATSNAINAIEYAKKMGAKISSNSWGCGGTGCYNQALKDAIDASGMLFVASAGNSGVNNDSSSSVGYPASYNSPNILSVAAVDNGGKIASFSNYGATSVDISAPGVSVLSSIPDRPDMSSVALSSVESSGKAVTAGFGAEEIGDTAKQASFMRKAFDAVGRGSQQVVLVDDDASDAPSPTFNFPNVRPELRDAVRTATGTTPTVINVPYGSNGPSFAQLQGKTVVWSTGQAWLSYFDSATGSIARTLTPADRQTLTAFLNDGGRLVLTGMDALYLNENDSFVTGTLGLKAQSDINRLRAFSGSSGTAFAGESYDLNSSTANSNLHDILAPAGSTAIQEGIYPSRGAWDYLNGTSMAAPHATGTAALAASVNPALLSDPISLKKAVMDGGKPALATDGKTVTGDMVDARAALGLADATGPQLKLPSDIVEEATSKDGAKVSYTATATDNVDGSVDVSCAPASGSTFSIGTTEVTCSAKDKAGNEGTASFNVTVKDTTAPTISGMPSDIIEEATSKDGAMVSYTSPTATDTVDGDVSVSCDPVSGSTFELGDTMVKCMAMDKAGNNATSNFKVSVRDSTAPTISGVPSDITEEAIGPSGAKVSYTAPTADDAVDGSVDVSCDPVSGSTFALGDSTVTCSATDEAGNKVEKTFEVTVRDTTAPTLTVPTSVITAEATSSSGANVDYKDTVSASDTVDGSITPDCSPASGGAFGLGDTTVTCSATDKAGNKAKGSFKVTVEDTTAPTISGIPSDITQEATGKDGAKVSFAATATDNVDGEVSVSCASDSNLKSGDTFPMGTTKVTCFAKDNADNEATDSFNVKVQDTTKPAISDLPSSGLITSKATGASGASVAFPSITATDKVDGSVPVSCTSDSGLKSGDTFPMGTTGVSCSAKDKAGNEATGEFNVKVSYDFKGFFRPVDNPDTVNKASAGRTIPVKFTLGGDMGLDVFYKDANGSTYPRSAGMTCGSTNPVDAIEETVTANASGLSYDENTGEYTYVWKTSKNWAGTCRQLLVKLKDGETYRAYFQFT